MKLTQRIAVLDFLRTEISCFLENPKAHEWNDLLKGTYILNSWFTEESVLRSFAGIQIFLEKDKLEKWIGNYAISAVLENPMPGSTKMCLAEMPASSQALIRPASQSQVSSETSV